MATEQYLQTLGQVVYTYMGLQRSITDLGAKLDKELIWAGDIKVLGSVAHDITLLSRTGNYPEMSAIADRFSAATNTFQGLLQTTPFTAADQEQALGSSELDTQWTLDKLQAFSELLTTLWQDTDRLQNTFQK